MFSALTALIGSFMIWNSFAAAGLGMERSPIAIAAAHGRNVTAMIQHILEPFPEPDEEEDELHEQLKHKGESKYSFIITPEIAAGTPPVSAP